MYDVSANPQNHQTRNFLELCNLYQYSQLIQVPTHITASSLVPWQSVENITDPNVAWNAWRNMFLNICDSHAPYPRKKVGNSNSPWLTPDLKKLMFERDKAKKIRI